jgi:hypothetical protein
MNTKYQHQVKSPYQATTARREVFDVTNKNHPVREIIGRYTNSSINLTLSFEEDRETVSKLKNDSIVAFTCIIRKGDRILGIGRGHSSLSPVNKYLERTVYTALNYSMIDSLSKATRVLDAFHTGQNLPLQSMVEPVVSKGYEMRDSYSSDKISEKQKSYLQELISMNVDEDEREGMLTQLDDLTRSEASDMIQSFKN